jgi:YggT family protein
MILLRIVDILFQVFFLFILARVIGSWIPELQRTKFMRFISYYTDPYLNLFRRIIPPLGMIDISPIVAIFALWVLEMVIKNILFSLLV